MAPSQRDRITVDLHGLKAALFERARALGVSPSGLVRHLGRARRSDPSRFDRDASGLVLAGRGPRRLSLRMSRETRWPRWRLRAGPA